MTQERLRITKAEWDRMPRDHRTGDPRKGTARILRWVEGLGTILVPVEVVWPTS